MIRSRPKDRGKRVAALGPLGAVVLTLSAPAQAVESTIYPGVGIGKVKLGMTEAQVKRVLGKWRFVNEQDRSHLSVGWGFGQWTVDFVSGKAVEVTTTLRNQKTATRIGPGSTWRALVRAYPHGVCAPNNGSWGGRVEYLVPHTGGTQTIYWLPAPTYNRFTGQKAGAWLVTEVHVRTRWVPLPEFAPTTTLRCASNWRTADSPLG